MMHFIWDEILRFYIFIYNFHIIKIMLCNSKKKFIYYLMAYMGCLGIVHYQIKTHYLNNFNNLYEQIKKSNYCESIHQNNNYIHITIQDNQYKQLLQKYPQIKIIQENRINNLIYLKITFYKNTFNNYTNTNNKHQPFINNKNSFIV